MGAHYAMDVMGGRTLALYDLAHLLANDPAYVGQSLKGVAVIKDFQVAVRAARTDMTTALQAACGNMISACACEDTGRLSNSAANLALYATTQTYNLPIVYAKNAGTVEDVGKLAPEAGYLLTIAFPSLTLAQADQILTETEGPGGGFLDNGSSFGVYPMPIRLRHTPTTCRVFPFSGVELFECRGNNIARDSEQRTKSVERIEPTIEAKRKLIEIGL